MDTTPKIIKSNSLPALILILAGLVFCVANALGWLETLCFTEGCRLTQNVKLLGLSLWWYGAGCLAVIGVLTVLKRVRLAFLVSAVALAADVFFLTWLALAAPCFNCMVGGLFFISVFFALFRMFMPPGRWAKVLVALWFFALAPNLFFTLQGASPPWPLYGSPNAPIRVFFAPTCPACHQTLQYFLPDIGKSVAVFPISRNETERKEILFMLQALKKGVDFRDAFVSSQGKKLPDIDLGLIESWKLTWRLWRNRIALTRYGTKNIPVVIMQGWPGGGRQ